MHRSAILGIGHYVPARVVTNDDLAKLMTTSDEWIVQRTGIKERRFIEHTGIGASDLAVPACEDGPRARRARRSKDVDAIIFATLSPDHNFPGSGCFLGDKLGLPGVPALDVRNQCSGFLYGLSDRRRVGARGRLQERAARRRRGALHGHRVHRPRARRGGALRRRRRRGGGRPRPRERGRGIKSIALHADGAGAKDLWLEAPASAYDPRLTHEMIDEGEHYPAMNGKQVFRWATEKMPEVAREVLADGGARRRRDVDLFVPHQANMRINQMVGAEARASPRSKTVHNIEQYGNTTAATIPLGLSGGVARGPLPARLERALRRVRQRLHLGRRRRHAVRRVNHTPPSRRSARPKGRLLRRPARR